MSEAAEERKARYVLQTAGFDARFPNTNQTKACWQNYLDYYKCVNAKGDDFAPCKQFKRAYKSLCPKCTMGRTARGWYFSRKFGSLNAWHTPFEVFSKSS